MKKLIKILSIPVNMAIAPITALIGGIAMLVNPIGTLNWVIENAKKELKKEQGK